MSLDEPRFGWYTFPHDFLDAGIQAWTEEIKRTGASAANVAVLYHTARDVLPRNPRRRIRFMTGGTHYFTPDPADFPDLARPWVDPEVQGTRAMEDIRGALWTEGLIFNAWTVFLHNSRLGSTQHSLAQRNAFGDPMLTDLCPANPVVRKYAVAAASQAAILGAESILAESLHYHGLRHGYHHERYLFELGNVAEFALSLCFCDHCRAAAHDDGVDVDGVAHWARLVALAAFDGVPQSTDGELTRIGAGHIAGEQLEAFLGTRSRVITGLVADVKAAANARGARLVFLDPAGAVKGWSDGKPTGAPVADTSWLFGIDVEAVGAVVDGYEVLGYTHDPERLASDLAEYRRRLGRTEIRVSMRPSAPDTDSAEHLVAKMRAASGAGVGAFDFYHLGLLPPTAPDRVAEALSRISPRAESR
jgi:hypothetical protein